LKLYNVIKINGHVTVIIHPEKNARNVWRLILGRKQSDFAWLRNENKISFKKEGLPSSECFNCFVRHLGTFFGTQ